MLSFIIALILTIAFSFLPERFVKPEAPRLNLSTILLQSLLVSILFLSVTLIVQRPIFSGLAVSIFLIILSAVSNAKFQTLREPMVFSDIAMFSQAFKHPRLYFPFLGLAPVIIAPLIIIALIITVLMLEPALAFSWQRILATLLAMVISFLLAKIIAQKLKLVLEPANDIAKHGLLNSLFAYSIQARTDKHQQQISKVLQNSPFKLSQSTPPPIFNGFDTKPPNITVIQSESFFDARRLHPSINTSVLENYDACLSESIQFGKLKVPAWGANTMRTEFTFLTGLKYMDMGFYRYYPYRYLHKMPVTSIASILQAQGYYCVCIHPHPASFFNRDRIFPKMGFDEFVDIGSFDSTDTFGPYVSDQAVTNKILEITQQITDKPLFLFAITMENHGPLHLEKTTTEEQAKYYSESPLDKINDLTVYLRHLKNADKMIQTLTHEYRQSDIRTTLCLYGDHVPSMPKIYDKLGYTDEHSDYFIWQSNSNKTSRNQNISVEYLANLLINYHHNISTT